jgi:hypothetical protein
MRVKLDQLDAISISEYDPKWDAPPTSSASVSSFTKARDGRQDHDYSAGNDDAISPVEDTLAMTQVQKDNMV